MKPEFDVSIIPERQITPDLERKIISLQSVAFPKARQFAHQRWISCRPGAADIWFLVTCKEDLVASAWLHRRTIETPVGSLHVGGIGNVCSHPGVRGKGAARRCMLDIQQYLLNSDGIDYGLLFCGDKVAGFYRALGWQTVHNSWRLTDSSGQPIEDDGCIRMIYPGKQDVESWPGGEINLCGPEW